MYLFEKVLNVVSSEEKLVAFCKNSLGLVEPRKVELTDTNDIDLDDTDYIDVNAGEMDDAENHNY